MIRNNSLSFLKININSFPKSLITSKSLLFFLIILNLFLLSCAPSKRFPDQRDKESKIEKEEETEKEEMTSPEFSSSEIRVLMEGLIPSESLLIGSPVYLYDQENKIAVIKTGNTINCFDDYGKIRLSINGESFYGEKFYLTSAEDDKIVKINGKRYRGKIQISSSSNSIDIINVLNWAFENFL